MPTNDTRSPYRRAASCNRGASSAQGPHHEAQKFTTTGLPVFNTSESVKVEPSNKPSEKSGAVVKGTFTTFELATSFACRPNQSKNNKATTTNPEMPAMAAGSHGRPPACGIVSSLIATDSV